MSITEILQSEDKPSEKLAAIKAIVKDVRESYDNLGTEIPMPEITTIDGEMPMSVLSDETKLEMVGMRVRGILVEVLEAAKYIPGLNTEKYVEAKIATDDVLANLSEKVSYGSL